MDKLFKKLQRNLRLDILSALKGDQTANHILRQNIDLGVAESVLCPRSYALVRMFRDFDKRYVPGSGKKPELNRVADATFRNAAELCRKQNDFFTFPDFRMWRNFSHVKILFMARDIIHDVMRRSLMSPNTNFVLVQSSLRDEPIGVPVAGFSTGPGVVSGNSSRLVVEKYPMSGKSIVDTQWAADVLSFVSRNHSLGGLGHEIVVSDAPLVMSYVPKDRAKTRPVIPQKNGSLFLQYPIGGQLELALRFLGIDLAQQPRINQRLACAGSYHHNLEGDYHFGRRSTRPCTIDLHASSEIIGRNLVEWLFPFWAFEYMDSCRATHVVIASDTKVPEVVEVPSMANMGNAYCFPLQTLVYTALAIAVHKYHRLDLGSKRSPTWSVFGDDIVVDRAAFKPLCGVLESLGMVVNQHKSFSQGLFRESCGEDYVSGYNVRPIMPTGVDNDGDRYVLLNLLAEWGSRHSCNLPRAVSFLIKGLKTTHLVSREDPHDAGIRWEWSVASELPQHLRSKLRFSVVVDMKRGKPALACAHNQYHEIEYWRSVIACSPARFSTEHVALFHLLRAGLLDRQLERTGRQKWISVRAEPVLRSEGEICQVKSWDNPVITDDNCFYTFADPSAPKWEHRKIKTALYGLSETESPLFLEQPVLLSTADGILTSRYLLRNGL